MYLGSYRGVSGTGLRALLEKRDSALAARVETEIDSAVSAVLAMGVFGTAMFEPIDPGQSYPAKVGAAVGAILTLRYTLICRMGPALLQWLPCPEP